MPPAKGPTALRETTLPDGTPIVEINSYETNFLYDEIFVQKAYEIPGIDVPSGGVIFDIGANIGLFSLYALRRFDDPKIFCFEPAPHCLSALGQNLSSTKSTVEIIGSALGREVGEADFTYYPHYSIMSGMFADQRQDSDVLRSGARTQFERAEGKPPDDRILDILVGSKLTEQQTFRCPVTTISQMIRDHGIDRIDLAKIDVERAENLILDGISEDDWSKIKRLVIEVHDQGNREHESMRQRLHDLGYSVSMFAEPILESSDIYMIVALRDQPA